MSQDADQLRIVKLFRELAQKYGKFDATNLFEEAIELAELTEED